MPELVDCADTLTPLEPPSSGLLGWLAAQAADAGCSTLLAVGDEGVTWARLAAGHWVSGHDVAPADAPALDEATLWWARAFGEGGEIMLWRGDGWRARRIGAGAGEQRWVKQYDEEQILWGAPDRDPGADFTRLRDGKEGLIHVLPLKLTGQGRVARLMVRHYLAADEYGFLRVVASRLRGLTEGQS